MKLMNLREAADEGEFGGKAANLAKGFLAEIFIPEGFALNVEFVLNVIENNVDALSELRVAFEDLASPVAVRSSAIGEDSNDASFAGQHLSILNVKTFDDLLIAIRKVAASAHTESAYAYREKLGIKGKPLMAIVVQKLIDVEAAGVMFSKNPVTNAQELVIEAAWGVGETVVEGLVIPDFIRMSLDGNVLEKNIGIKDLKLCASEDGGVEEVEVDDDIANKPVLDDEAINKLYKLSKSCKQAYGDNLDMEWGMLNGEMYLLQCRGITTQSV